MLHSTEDTIYALSSPYGTGAIAIIRLSGNNAIDIINKLFSKNLSNAKGYTVHYGTIKENGEIIDDVIVTVFKAPHSFTGEDSVEIACHGSKYIQNKILELLSNAGGRMAEAGEFSKRAFFNGKFDLSQTEAIADLIHSENEAMHKVAMQQMKGGITRQLSVLRQKMIDFASLIELELDFSEEDVEFADRTELISLVNDVYDEVERLEQSFKLGNAIKNGVNTVIVGRPNAGKSTLLNALLNEDRAIVSATPGTTRDTIEEVLTIEGVEFRFIDTAGLRNTTDEIEKIGVEKALQQVNTSALYIYLFDANTITAEELKEDLKKLPENIDRLIVGNKNDTLPKAKKEQLSTIGFDIMFISAQAKENIEELKKQLVKKINLQAINTGTTIITNARHYEILSKVKQDLTKVKNGLKDGISGDFLAMDIRQATHYLGTITGEVSTDDLLGNIFANFCIGK